MKQSSHFPIPTALSPLPSPRIYRIHTLSLDVSINLEVSLHSPVVSSRCPSQGFISEVLGLQGGPQSEWGSEDMINEPRWREKSYTFIPLTSNWNLGFPPMMRQWNATLSVVPAILSPNEIMNIFISHFSFCRCAEIPFMLITTSQVQEI